MNEFGYRGYDEKGEENIDERIEEGQCLEVKPEVGEVSRKEVQAPVERVVIADAMITPILEKALEEADPEGDAAIVMIEYVESPTDQRSKSKGLEKVAELAENGRPVIISGFMTESMYAVNPNWHRAISYPNVYFLRLPYQLSELKDAITLAKESTRPEDPLGKRLPDLKADVSEIATLEHNLKYAIEGGMFKMQEWEEKARRILGNEKTLDEIIEIVKRNDASSIAGELEGESFPDLCVDLEGTLIKNDEIDIELLTKIKEEAKERPITLWTGGDLKQLEKKIRQANIPFKLLSKYWLKGATVAKAIDDMPYEEFREKYGVQVEDYKQLIEEEK